jgi:hypothetical protein
MAAIGTVPEPPPVNGSVGDDAPGASPLGTSPNGVAPGDVGFVVPDPDGAAVVEVVSVDTDSPPMVVVERWLV